MTWEGRIFRRIHDSHAQGSRALSTLPESVALALGQPRLSSGWRREAREDVYWVVGTSSQGVKERSGEGSGVLESKPRLKRDELSGAELLGKEAVPPGPKTEALKAASSGRRVLAQKTRWNVGKWEVAVVCARCYVAASTPRAQVPATALPPSPTAASTTMAPSLWLTVSFETSDLTTCRDKLDVIERALDAVEGGVLQPGPAFRGSYAAWVAEEVVPAEWRRPVGSAALASARAPTQL